LPLATAARPHKCGGEAAWPRIPEGLLAGAGDSAGRKKPVQYTQVSGTAGRQKRTTTVSPEPKTMLRLERIRPLGAVQPLHDQIWRQLRSAPPW